MQVGDRCFVSGVSGYLGSWIARELLIAGFRVRGSIRTLGDDHRVSVLKRLLPGIDLVAADLRHPKGWSEAVNSCEWVFHVASPQAVKSERERTAGALDGTRYLLQAVAADPTVRKVVVTSSEAAIAYGHPRHKRSFSEDDWTDIKGLGPRADYHRSKTLAERLAWDWAADARMNPRRIPVSAVNPALILGPSLVPWSRFSLQLLGDMAKGKMPLLLDMKVRVVDVRDCARMHIALMRNDDHNGRRHLCMALSTTLADIAKSVARTYRPSDADAPIRLIPSWLARALAPMSGDLSSVRSHIGNDIDYTTRYPDVYRYEYTDLDEVIQASIDSMLKHGWLRPHSA